jgi:PAS domain S-box-containing protein
MEPGKLPLDLGALGHPLIEALDHAGIGVTIVVEGEQLERVFINAAGAATLGYSLAEAYKLPPLLAVVPEDRERFARLRQNRSAPGLVECTVIGKDGTLIPVEVGLAVASYEGKRATIAFLRDITERKRVELALRESESRFKKLAEAAPDVIVVIERDRFLYANPAGVRALRLKDREEFLALHPSQFLSPEDLLIMRERVERAAAGELLAPREYKGTRSDGSVVVLEISSTAVEWEGRRAVLAYGRDVTDRSRLQSQIAEHDRLAAVGTLAAGVAHEVNNPLTYLMLHLEHLKKLLPRTPSEEAFELLSHVDEALEGAERVSNIVRELLELARPREPRKEPTRLLAVCEAAVKLARPTFEGEATITVSVAQSPLLLTDPARLIQVLINLLVNAAQATLPNQKTRISVTAWTEGASAVIEVADNGPGIPQELLRDIFTPFFTTKHAVSSAEGNSRCAGMGLGLSICHSIVESLGGTIRAENRPPNGAVFRVELPLGNAEASERPNPQAPQSETPLGFHRVAVIDDEAAVAKAIAAIVAPELSPVIFTSSSEALRHLEAEATPYDVVLCDILMPELRGNELESRLLGVRPEYQGRFVFMTGATAPEELRSRYERGETQILQKPFGPRQLQEALRLNEQSRRA